MRSIWFGTNPVRYALLPLAWLFRLIVWARRKAYLLSLLDSYRSPVPVIIVGNITVGGTGKTPLVIWLVGFLSALGFRPGIVARGYRGKAGSWPQQVRRDSDPVVVGDEAIILARRTDRPVAVGPSRGDAIQALLTHSDTNIVVSDDGLQHYAVTRDIEVAVLDGKERLGNGLFLPAGPLREPVSRLKEVDFVVAKGVASRGEFAMKYRADMLHNVAGVSKSMQAGEFRYKKVHAVAGLGQPEGFFNILKRLDFDCVKHVFPDHYYYSPSDFDFEDNNPIIMSEKDAVKCETFADERFWYISITAEMQEVFERRFKLLLDKVLNG
jgi:tetraacyldisaccharide 4'-kinase